MKRPLVLAKSRINALGHFGNFGRYFEKKRRVSHLNFFRKKAHEMVTYCSKKQYVCLRSCIVYSRTLVNMHQENKENAIFSILNILLAVPSKIDQFEHKRCQKKRELSFFIRVLSKIYKLKKCQLLLFICVNFRGLALFENWHYSRAGTNMPTGF